MPEWMKNSMEKGKEYYWKRNREDAYGDLIDLLIDEHKDDLRIYAWISRLSCHIGQDEPLDAILDVISNYDGELDDEVFWTEMMQRRTGSPPL
jgi:hypothetical protein